MRATLEQRTDTPGGDVELIRATSTAVDAGRHHSGGRFRAERRPMDPNASAVNVERGAKYLPVPE
ncbi:hypothetical protein [Streptomyces sp. IBSBF 2806]|uniref:hypothetical protein n=1 Tax=Streptomyces sp. IBSBF 2806 TaxID=2903529 RepID=UPI002FDBB875